VLLCLGALSPAGWGATPVQAEPPGFEALRTSEPPHIDGRLDEATWQQAPVFSDFHQSRPNPGAPPSERTEVRVLHDDANLYVGVRCFDRQPHTINAQLGRRDHLPSSDAVWIMIDSLRDRLTGLSFAVNAGGTLQDSRILNDLEMDDAWVGVWEGSASRDEQGWSAELRIPVKLLRVPEGEEQHWGFHVRRVIARTHEQLDSVPLPPEVNALVSRFTELHSLHHLKRPRYLTLLPYVATRLAKEPQPTGPRLLIPTLDVGLDVQASLTRQLALAVTFNPEFGQIEGDEFTVNRTRLETRLTERRPFFLDETEPFAPVDGEFEEQALFYSRRIGQELPLLGAVKLSGALSERLQVGVLTALEAGVANPQPEQPFAYHFHAERPLHLAPNVSLPAQVPPPRHFFMSVARLQTGEGHTLGAAMALATPLRSECQLGAPEEEEGCRASGGRAVAADASLRSSSGDYTLAAQVAGSQVTGGPVEGTVLGDGTLLKGGDTGLGVQLAGGKLGGEPWQMDFSYRFASPRLELNPTGYQRVNNEQILVLAPQYVRPEWAGLLDTRVGLQSTLSWSTDSRLLPLGTSLELFGSTVWPDFTSTSCHVGTEWGRKDLHEIWQEGVAFQRPSNVFLGCSVSSDSSRILSLSAQVELHSLLDGPDPSRRPAPTLSQTLTWKPLPRLETLLGVAYVANSDGPRWLERTEEEELHLFGEVKSRFLISSLRQLVVLTPPLTLQAFAQLVSFHDRLTGFYEGRVARGGLLRLGELIPSSLEEPSSTSGALLNLHVLLRWEYKLGSTLFVVYTHSQQSRPSEEGEARLTLLPKGLLAGPRIDSFLVKFNYLW
jgi:hypothetical protein